VKHLGKSPASPLAAAALVAAALSSNAAVRPVALLVVRDNGTLEMRTAELDPVARFRVYLHGVDWLQTAAWEARERSTHVADSTCTMRGRLPVHGNPADCTIAFEEVLSGRPRGVRISVRFAAEKAVRLNACSAALFWPVAPLQKRTCRMRLPDGTWKELTLPEKFRELQPWQGEIVELRLPTRPTLVIRPDKPAHLLIQDNRQFRFDEFEFRFNFVQAGSVPAGWRDGRTFDLEFAAPVRFVPSESAPEPAPPSDWLVWRPAWDAPPVDASFLVERPAGRHGFLEIREGRFVFEDGTPARFWGVNLSAAASFPDKAAAPRIAARIARMGVNIVRVHHADAQWADRCFIDYSRGDSRHFDEENLDRFDFFMAELRKRGVYVYLDQLVNRKFLPGDGVDAADKLEPAAKPYSVFDPRLIELQKEYSRRLWTHINPYTGLAPRDDPQYVLAEFTNENDLFTQPVTLEPYRSRLEKRYRAWAAAHGVRLSAGRIDFTRRTPSMLRFFVDVQTEYYREMSRYFRERLKVRIPLTGSNWSRNVALLKALTVLDYTDSHAYHDHPRDGYRRFYNTLAVRGRRTIFSNLAFNRLDDRPFFVSEWDQPWPNEWRAEMPLAMAAIAALQGWSGATAYTYRHDWRPADYIENPFETALDPARFGLFPHAAMLFFRDVHPAKKTVAVRLGGLDLDTTPGDVEVLTGLPEIHRTIMTFSTKPQADQIVFAKTSLPETTRPILKSDTGEYRRDPQRGVARIDTPGAQAAWGLLGEAGPVRLSSVTFTVRNRFAVVALSSMNFLPVGESNRLLLTAVGRVRNTGQRYNVLHTMCLEKGRGPLLVEPIRGTVELRTALQTLRVYTLNERGERLREIPSEWKDGTLRFRIGEPAETIRYMIASN